MRYDIKPINTTWEGYRFRSRCEARWAIYFTSLGIEFQYELEAYDLKQCSIRGCSELGPYLPDFFLPQVRMWAEVKPDKFSEIETLKCAALAEITERPCLMLDGPPQLKPYWAREPFTLGGGENDYLIDNTFL